MALVNQDLVLDVVPGPIPRTLHLTEYDENMEVVVTLMRRGQPFQIPTGTTVKIEGTLKGHPFSEDGTPSGNTVTFMVSKNMTAYSGRAWTKIKLTQNSKPVSTCGFWLDCDRAGVEADAVIGASGFEQQIVDAVQDWLDEHPPASGGLTDDVKTALLDCFENVAWINDQGQTYYDALYAALYPPVDVLSISAVFTQGEAVIYDTDSLNTLKQYLVVTATMTDSTTQTVTDYTLSGTLTVGTSTITVSYGGKTTTFNVTVTERDAIPSEYQKVEYIEATGNQYFRTGIVVGSSTMKILAKYYKQTQATKEEALICGEIHGSSAGYEIGFTSTANRLFAFSASSATITDPLVYGNVNEIEVDFNPSSPYATIKLTNGATELSESKTTANNSNIANSQLDLFYTGKQTTACSARLYYCKVYTDTNVLAFNGIPCYRKNDNIAGMYDTVSGTFFSSGSSVQFLKGGDV